MGDEWCGENFSWFSNTRARPVVRAASYSQTDDSLDKGGRVLRAIVRPYPAKIAGIPLDFRYDLNTGELSFAWANPDPKAAPSAAPATVGRPPLDVGLVLTRLETEIFVPAMLARGRRLLVTGAGFSKEHYEYAEDVQTLYVRNVSAAPGYVHRIRVAFDPPLEPVFEVTSHWWDFRVFYSIIAIVISALVALFMRT